MRTYVETNFLLEQALEQPEHAACEEIIRLAESKSVSIVLPAFSLVEAALTLERKHQGRTDLLAKLANEAQQLRRSTTFTAAADAAQASLETLVVQTIQQGDLRLRNLYARLLAIAEVLPLSATVFGQVEKYRTRFQHLKLPDAIVLTSVLSDPLLGSTPSCFLNRDVTGFDDPAIHDELRNRQCKLLGSFVDGLGYIKSKIST